MALAPLAPAITSVQVRDVMLRYGSTLALRGVTASFAAKRITVIEGANGSGKSTLLAVIGTLLRPTAGAVRWDPWGDDPAAVRAHVGWLGHEARVYPDLSGFDNLQWAARLYGLGSAAVEAVGERLGLSAFAKRPVRTMSRGQRQRVALARALLHRPSLLLLDEPTTGLDHEGSARLRRVFREEADAGAIVVVIAHDAGLAAELGADVVRLRQGRREPGGVAVP